jgi:hypothetical protein
MKTDDDNGADNVLREAQPEWLRWVVQQVNSLKYGTVQITVHDSRVTQVERIEKVRLDGLNQVKNKNSQ